MVDLNFDVGMVDGVVEFINGELVGDRDRVDPSGPNRIFG